MTDKQTCDGLDCAWCMALDCPRENERLKARVKELEEQLDKIEKLIEPYQTEFETDVFSLPTAIECVLERMVKKLEIALNSLNYITILENNYIVAKLDAQQALQKIEEVKLSNNSNPKKTIKIFGKEIDEDVARKALQQVLDEIADYEEECKKNGKNTKEVSND